MWNARCPIVHARAELKRLGASDADIAKIDAEVDAVIEDAVAFATASPEPHASELLAHVGAGMQP